MSVSAARRPRIVGGVSYATPDNWCASIYRNTEKRAAKHGTEFTLTRRELLEIAQRANGCCEVTGIPFAFNDTDHYRRPWVPSIDRIDSGGGYTKDNCRLVCYAVNCAMGEWGEQVLRIIATSLHLKEHGK